MNAYMIVTLTVSDPEWVRDYRRAVRAMIERAGGRYLAQAQAPEVLESDGSDPQTVAIVEFPSREAAVSFFGSAEYQPYARARRGGASTAIYLAEGTASGG